jgi:ABC-type transporter Mla subunit MlaD
MKAFQIGTGTILRDISQAAEKFDVQGKALAAAAEQIDTSNRRTDEVMADRREALDSVVNQIDSKVGDLDQRLKRFSALLSETFEAAEGRARDIARVLAESSTEGTKAIANQYELVRQTTDEERKRTSEALNSIYEQATGETSALFRQTSERFIEIVRQMREMSAAMSREMEATRGELRKGILELPQETADSAAQMRRVIVEQIDALAELNRIVARHGGGATAEQQPARRAEPMAASGGARPEARPTRMETTGGARSNPPPARRPEPQPAAPEGGRGGGWLTDLLGRASRDEPSEAAPDNRQARHAMESLDSLSVDIARMIDHDAAAEFWERYKRGERNVFTRRLYTLQGQKTFEEIRKRYRSDREFKSTVDRYIGEFERLLNEVSQDERGQATARSYLTSDTGKVYTMLAHAAGRFE